jgi:hypothetical protein
MKSYKKLIAGSDKNRDIKKINRKTITVIDRLSIKSSSEFYLTDRPNMSGNLLKIENSPVLGNFAETGGFVVVVPNNTGNVSKIENK